MKCQFPIIKSLIIAGGLAYCAVSIYASEFFELSPIRYSKSTPDNAVSNLATKTFKRTAGYSTDLAFLKTVLKELNISEDTQLLVFSKTSVQKRRIFPRYPRALYFSDSTYVGYVPGGSIEVITHDPKLGLVFYMLSPESGEEKHGITVERKASCLSCHVSSRTKGVPGLFARSLFTDEEGEINFKKNSFDVDDQTPLSERWGGWYVTGNWSGISHLGNDRNGESKLQKLEDVKDRIEASRYLKDTSDIAALLVFEHQCRMHTLFVEAKFQYERSLHLETAIHMGAKVNPEESTSLKTANNVADGLVEGLLFCDEATIGGDGIEGNKEFETAFIAKAKVSKSGKHLRKLRLYGRLFKYRCSYMIHSEAFEALPEIVKKLTFQKLHAVLTAETAPEKFEHLKGREKATILEILGDTTAIKKYVK